MRILFVCHGNICRSPMAEFIMKKLVRDAGLSEEFYIASAATSDEEISYGVGNPIYPPAGRELTKNGVPFDERQARQLTISDKDKYDLFIGMDSANIRNMHRILGEASTQKIRKLMDYTNRGGDVADPWYSDRFDIAYHDIYDGCTGLLRELKKNML